MGSRTPKKSYSKNDSKRVYVTGNYYNVEIAVIFVFLGETSVSPEEISA